MPKKRDSKCVFMTSASLCGIAALLAITTGAQAQDATPPAPDTLESQVVVVTGFKKSYADALKAKRSNVGITDGISSDGMGRFPDLNVGEALQRVPGVQINREAESRNATINLRGLPGTYARVTMNGVGFADPILDDSTPLGAFNSDIFSAISIIKSPSAADQPGGLSGNIDLQFQPALQRKDGGSAKVSAEYNELGGYTTPSFTLGYNKHFGHDLAVFGVAAYRKEQFRRDSIFFNQYTTLNPNTTPDFTARYADYYAPYNSNNTCPAGSVCATTGTGLKSTQGVTAPTDIRQAVKYNEGSLISLAGGIDYRASDTMKYGLNGFYTRRVLENAATDILDIDMRNSATVINPNSDLFTLADGKAYVNSYDYSNANVYASYRQEPVTQQTAGLNATTEWKRGAWRVATISTMSQAENHLYQTQLDIRNTAKTAGNGTSGAFFSGGTDIGDYLFTLNPSPAVTDVSGPWSYSGSGPSLTNAAGNVFIIAGSEGYARNQLAATQVDAERYFSAGFITSVQFGTRLEHDKFTSQGYRTSAAGVQSSKINSQFITGSAFANDFFGGDAGQYLSNWQTVNFDYAVSQLQPVTVGVGQTLTATGWINDPTNGSFLSYNFTNANAIVSSYAMAKFATTLGGIDIRGNTGLRYEGTRNTITALDKNASGNLVQNTYKHNYDNLLPSLLIAADLTDSLVLRGAAYSTFVRPQPRQVSPSTQVSGALSTGYSVTLGAPDLKPYKANSFDLSLEWYNRPNGLIALDIFEKDIKGIVAAVTDKSLICPTDGSAWGLGTLTWNGTSCVSSLTYAGNPVTVNVSGVFNNPNNLKVRGVEFNIQQNLDFLPAPWDKLGGAFNYSYTTISGKYPNGTKAILPGVSKNNVNLIGYYETKTFGVRVVYNYRDKYDLAAGGTFSGAARQVKARGQVDASASYNLNERISLSFDAFNLGNAKRVEYQNEELMPRRVDYDGRTYQFSVRASF